MLQFLNKKILNFLVIIVLSFITFWWTSFIFHLDMAWNVLATIIGFRILASLLIFKDFSLSWSKSTQKTFLIKTTVVGVPTVISMGVFYGDVRLAFLISEASFYLVSISLAMYSYYYYINRSGVSKTKSLVIYGAGKAGNKLEDEFRGSEYKVKYFVDDDKILQGRSIDGIRVISKQKLKELVDTKNKYDLLVIAMPSANKDRIKQIHENLSPYFKQIKILPTIEEILRDKNFSSQLKDFSVEDLLARHPKDLDKKAIKKFIGGKKVLITGAGGSIGSEIARQCANFGASELILLDHSEFNLYQIAEELCEFKPHLVMQSVSNIELLDKTFEKYMPDIVIHAAAYKHVPLVEDNIGEAIINNIIGTKNSIDCAIKYNVKKFVLISTDKAVRPTNVMGTTKRICELYAQNINTPQNTEIVAVRFGNVLGSSGSVIPKFKAQIEAGKNITVTHPDITRYFMLIPEACELVLQAGSIGRGGEIFILDMGEPIKIVDLAKKMIELSGRDDIDIEFSGLRPGEKLYEELLINDSDMKTEYESITVAGKTEYDIKQLNQDIIELLSCENKIEKLKKIVPEFDHKLN
ncbi:nucleoside-diphosphate sugar epimerase/dehydratase [Aliarcobacter butzleri]|uniref:Nucleoside-diphosphate sugar epimerase/dehydratase n=1 Tax=Aliarcobacter butzleri TaxID=28197 RepID=A0AAW6VQM9_9BACT|nr:nucleoside-diphosphate sugar epimerase/dehydratase [Aliarcobacter butzleri]MDK2062902.1 nucleoside-diphosphate sugar epimerase/dehydratase [Aliarcobacter butzleri]